MHAAASLHKLVFRVLHNASCDSLRILMLQGMVQQQYVVKAVQTECKVMQHEASRQASAMQLLESAADKRRMEERSLEHDFWESAREALGK